MQFALPNVEPVGRTHNTLAAKRLIWLDGLRSVAVFSVLCAHMLQYWSVYDAYRGDIFQMGLFGVVVFFFTSGYIIPISALRHQSFSHFWWARIWRLYPAYWLSVGWAVLWLWLGVTSMPGSASHASASVVVWNFSVLAAFAQQPLLIGVYWTLGLELVFYVLVSLALVLRLLQYPALFAGGLLATCVLLQILLPAEQAVIFTQWTLFVACLWCGSVAQQVQSGVAPRRTGWAIGLLWLGVVLLQLALPGTTGMVAAELAAGALSLAALLWRPRILLGVWCWLGQISYSLYLFHLLIVEALPWAQYPLCSTFLAILLSLGVAAVGERLVERPGIAFGRWIATRSSSFRTRSLNVSGDQRSAVTTER